MNLDPNIAAVYNNRGGVYTARGEYDHAIQDHNKAIELDPRSAEAYSNRGVVYWHQGEYLHAIEDFDKAIEIDSSHAPAYYNRGESYLFVKDWGKAGADFLMALQLGFDVVAQFQSEFGDVAAFEQQHDIQLPANIAAMLTGPQ